MKTDTRETCPSCGGANVSLDIPKRTAVLLQRRIRCDDCGSELRRAYRVEDPAPPRAELQQAWSEDRRYLRSVLGTFFEPRVGARTDGVPAELDLVEALLRDLVARLFRTDTTDRRLHPDGHPGIERPHVACTVAIRDFARVVRSERASVDDRRLAAAGLAVAAAVSKGIGFDETRQAMRESAIRSADAATEVIEYNGRVRDQIPQTREEADAENPHLLELLNDLAARPEFERLAPALRWAIRGTAARDAVAFVNLVHSRVFGDDVVSAIDSSAAPTIQTLPEVAHSEDFSSVRWFGSSYEFTKRQAACVEALWAAWAAGTPTLKSETIGDRAGSSANQFRMDHVFRDAATGGPHPAWGTMIVAAGRGRFRLQEPNP